jgi:HD-like signal output (HDOD) protein
MDNIWKRLFARDERPGFAHADGAAMPWTAVPEARPAPLPATALGHAEIEDRFFRLVLGMAPPTAVEPRLPELAMLKRLDQICGADRFDIGSLPRLPTVLPQLLRLLRTDNTNGSKLAELIGRDPVLVGEVMRITQSVHYRTLKPVVSLQHAVVLLGQDGLQQMVTAHVMKPILQASAGMFGHAAGQRLWDHAERCAHASMYLAKGQADPFEAFLAGVVCNVGVGAVIRVLDQEAPPTLGVFSRRFLAGCAWIASHLTLRAAQHWELPPHVIEALHERMSIRAQPPSSELGKALLDADHLAMIQMLAENQRAERHTPPAADRPGQLPLARVERAQQDLQRNFSPPDFYSA